MFNPVSTIVIVGFPRSGTTLLRTILARHPSLNVEMREPHYIPELQDAFGAHIDDVEAAVHFITRHRKFPREQIDEKELRKAFEGTRSIDLSSFLLTYYGVLFGQDETKPLVIKLPRLVFRLEAVQSLFPNVRVVHVIRDPRGAIASHMARWPEGRLWDRIETWRAALQVGRAWGAAHPEAYAEVQFERLVTEPDQQMQRLFRSLDVPFREDVLDVSYAMPQWSLEDPGTAYVERFTGIDVSKVRQWQEMLSAKDIRVIEQRCRGEMDRLAYVPDQPYVPLLVFWGYYWKVRIHDALANIIAQ